MGPRLRRQAGNAAALFIKKKDFPMLQDRYGNPLSTHSRAAVDKYNAALELIRLYRGDPIAALDAAIEEDPNFAMAWAARAALLGQQTDKAYLDEVERSLKAGMLSGGNARERAH